MAEPFKLPYAKIDPITVEKVRMIEILPELLETVRKWRDG